VRDTEAFGQILREHRLRRGLSQEGLGLESGFHRTYISQLERGLKNPSLSTIIRLSEILGVAAAEMVRLVELRSGGSQNEAGPAE
jgi:transcriptional regulator with XRE-family HTH domain